MATTPYMNLVLPDPTVTSGPDWSEELNTAMTSVDAHDHTSGYGQQVPSAGININADLPMNSKNLTSIRSLRMSTQASTLVLASDVGCLYQVSGNLYYNNGSGTAIRITVGSALDASTIGGIGGDYATSTASMFYTNSSKTFTLWQDTSTPAKLDLGDIILRNISTPTNAITLKAPGSLAASYSLTLAGALPASTMFVACDSSGNLSFTNSLVTMTLSGAITVSGTATFNGAVMLGDAAGDNITITGTLTSNLIPTDSTYTIGDSTHSFTRLSLDNGATDGGAVLFNSGTTAFLKSNAAGTILNLGGFASFDPTTDGASDLGSTGGARWGKLCLNTAIGSSTPSTNTLYRDTIIKAWSKTAANGSITKAVNLTAGTKTLTGVYPYNFRTNMDSASYAVIAVPFNSSIGFENSVHIQAQSSSSFTVVIQDSAGNGVDTIHYVMVVGDQ